MSRHLQRRIEKLKQQILDLGGLVEQALRDALRALDERDVDLARAVVRVDAEIDQREIELEEECLSTLALEQPVAFDLRYVVAVMKMNNDLERIGDLAANIAGQVVLLAEVERLENIPFDLPGMERLVLEMLKSALDSLLTVDLETADAVRRTDDRVDEIYARMFEQVEREMEREPSKVRQLVHLLNVARNLERIADHACNIAEDVLYLGRGDIVRHELKDRDPE